MKTLAYKEDGRILEIRFKNGQVWQLFGVPPDVVPRVAADAERDPATKTNARPATRADSEEVLRSSMGA